MTKKEREIVQGFINKIQLYREQADEEFKFLQEENGRVNGTRWCSATQNYRELLKAGRDCTGAYNRYIEAEAKIDAIMWFGQDLADIGFWKHSK